ncbi:hypothetical protein SLS55_006843 [Diplodia seriata]|uniref:Nephrocystin 3-like N-terminal domain-containing protein n=1 Tax=Diplodia seriata TaxID=420778 RepID=A0ABR3CAM0_9PEZI
MTDIAGVIIGVPGLINDILDLRDRWEMVVDHELLLESRKALLILHRSLLRLRTWIAYSGFDGEELGRRHHPRLEDQDYVENAKSYFGVIREICKWLRSKFRKIRQDAAEDGAVSLEIPVLDQGPKRPRSPFRSRVTNFREGVRWSIHGQRFSEQVRELSKMVNHLFEDFPESRNMRLDLGAGYVQVLVPETAPGDGGRILWIHGRPGYGKSIICARVVQSLVEHMDGEQPVAHAFCSTLAESQNSLDIIPRVWLSQLVRQNSSARDIAFQHFVSTSSSEATTRDSLRLLRSILSGVPRCTLVLDGLDEFKDRGERAAFLQDFRTAISWTDTRVLVMSRSDNREEISSSLKHYAGPTFMEYEITEHDVESDVVVLARKVVDESLPNRAAELNIELANQLSKTSAGSFLWIKLQKHRLQAGRHSESFTQDGTIDFGELSDAFEGSWQHVKAMQLLINYGSGFEALNRDGLGPLHLAIIRKHPDVAKYLLNKGADPSTPARYGETALHFAAESGDGDLVEILLKHGVDPAKKTVGGNTALLLAAGNAHNSVIDRLFRVELDVPSLVGHSLWLPYLNEAARTGNLHLLRLVVKEQRAESFSPDPMGRSALHLAARAGNVEVFDFLHDHGFDSLGTDHAGRSILHYACQSGSVQMTRHILRLPVAERLLSSEHEWTPLFWAARAGNAQLVTDLMLAGLRETTVSTDGMPGAFTPFSLAAYHGNDGLPAFEKFHVDHGWDRIEGDEEIP